MCWGVAVLPPCFILVVYVLDSYKLYFVGSACGCCDFLFVEFGRFAGYYDG